MIILIKNKKQIVDALQSEEDLSDVPHTVRVNQATELNSKHNELIKLLTLEDFIDAHSKFNFNSIPIINKKFENQTHKN